MKYIQILTVAALAVSWVDASDCENNFAAGCGSDLVALASPADIDCAAAPCVSTECCGESTV